MTQEVLNSIGLVLGMLGVVVIFKYGPPQPRLDAGQSIGLEDGTILENGLTVADENRLVLRRRNLHSCMSKAGLVLVFVGFGFQLAATWTK